MLVGITGKIGSGKSLLSSFFKKKGIPIYSSDNRSKILMNKISFIKNKIIKYFGKDSYKNEKVNKNYLSNIIFNNYFALKLMCKIVHPWINLDFKKWIYTISKKKKNILYAIKESAILFESGSYKKCDTIITTISPMENMIKRVMKRDNITYIDIINRLKNQISNKKRKKKSNIIIYNYSSKIDLQEKAELIHNMIVKKIKKYG
ncbi:dephospho-CoA kinase [Blattabacterium cuenoti]|uniref:dephospho-CoA kinase n=1 Tax=Blattabacterium cuenoti TaxID=1653831 RepID=UPI00163B8DA5|nr:dephospho-CoA kinase [Blattabacterium cuenoti]